MQSNNLIKEIVDFCSENQITDFNIVKCKNSSYNISMKHVTDRQLELLYERLNQL